MAKRTSPLPAALVDRTNSKAAGGSTTAALPCPPYEPRMRRHRASVEAGNEVASFTITSRQCGARSRRDALFDPQSISPAVRPSRYFQVTFWKAAYPRRGGRNSRPTSQSRRSYCEGDDQKE
jgi:hypothetical protein